LREQGAFVASGIIVGLAHVLAAHIRQRWPVIAQDLQEWLGSLTSTESECLLPPSLRGIPRLHYRSSPWTPPTLRLRMIRVRRCGWHVLHTPRAIVQLRGSRSAQDLATLHADVESPHLWPPDVRVNALPFLPEQDLSDGGVMEPLL
jgi:hypothetical protein